VRQLESLIRLSEASARMYCADEVCTSLVHSVLLIIPNFDFDIINKIKINDEEVYLIRGIYRVSDSIEKITQFCSSFFILIHRLLSLM